jgi:uncharacterized protein YkwD
VVGREFTAVSVRGTLLAALLLEACAPDSSGSIAVGQRHDAATAELAAPDTMAPTGPTADATAQDPDVPSDAPATAADTLADTVTIPETTTATTTVCERWNADRADLREGSWSGSAASCAPGALLEPGPANTLRQVNLYRWLAGLPPVEADADLNVGAQACSLAMHANQTITHDVPASFSCYTALGAATAKVSNIATTAAVYAIDLYMADPGNEQTLGHRRWILSNSLGPIGIGSTSRYSCLSVIGGKGHAGRAWTAWPPEGVVPYGALVQGGNGGQMSVDVTGWSIQSDSLDLGRRDVTVTRDGEVLPITTDVLLGGYGSSSAIKITPAGWHTEPGHTYHVELGGGGQPIAYDVVVVDCD